MPPASGGVPKTAVAEDLCSNQLSRKCSPVHPGEARSSPPRCTVYELIKQEYKKRVWLLIASESQKSSQTQKKQA